MSVIKVKVEMTIEIDADAWAEEYGCDRAGDLCRGTCYPSRSPEKPQVEASPLPKTGWRGAHAASPR